MRTTTAVVVGLLVLLGACSQPEVIEPEPAASPTASARPAPTMPEQAREDSDEGRVAFVAHWIDVFNHAQATGEVDDLRQLSGADCAGCQEYIDLFAKTYDAGGYFKDADLTIERLSFQGPDGQKLIFAEVTADATRYKSSPDGSEEVGQPQDQTLVFEIDDSNGERVVDRVRRAD